MDIPIPTDTLAKYVAGIGLALLIGGGTLVYTTYVTQQQEAIKLATARSKYDSAQGNFAYEITGRLCAASDRVCIQEGEALRAKEEAEKAKQAESLGDIRSQREAYDRSMPLWNKQLMLGGALMLLGALGAGWGFKGWRDAERKQKDIGN